MGSGWEVRGLTRSDADLTDPAQITRLWRARPPQLVIHGAALSRTGACELDPVRARTINVEATRVLATLPKPFRSFFSPAIRCSTARRETMSKKITSIR